MSFVKYDAFISYSHSIDPDTARMIQNGLRKLAKPWYKLESLKVFRDSTNLTASPGLWPDIEKALRQSEYLILLASPGAASSKWVSKEVEFWLSNKSKEKLLIALVEGKISWKHESNDFDWAQTNCLPLILSGRYNEEPLFADFTGAIIDLSNNNFKFQLSKLSSKIQGITPDELIGEDFKQHRKTQILKNFVLSLVSAFVIVIGYLTYTKVKSADGNEIAIAGMIKEEFNPTEAYIQVLDGFRISGEEHLFELACGIYNRNSTYRSSYQIDGLKLCDQGNNGLLLLSDNNNLLYVDPHGLAHKINYHNCNSCEIEQIEISPNCKFMLLKYEAVDSVYLYDIGGNMKRSFPAIWGEFSGQTGDLKLLSQTLHFSKFVEPFNSERPNYEVKLPYKDNSSNITCLSSENDSVIVIGHNSNFKVLNPLTNKIINNNLIVSDNCEIKSISANGQYIGIAEGQNIIITDVFGNIIDKKTKNDNVKNMLFSSTSDNVFISSCVDNTVHLDIVGSSGKSTLLKAHNSESKLCFSRDGCSFTTYDSQNIFTWDVIGAPIKVIESSPAIWSSVRVAKISEYIAAADMDGNLKVWNTTGVEIFSHKISDRFNKNRFVFIDEVSILACIAKNQNYIEVLDICRGKVLHQYEQPGSKIQCVTKYDGKGLVGITESGFIIFWDVYGKIISKVKAFDDATSCLSISIKRDIILTADDTGIISLINYDGTIIDTLLLEGGGVIAQTADMSSDGKFIIAAGNENKTYLYKRETNSYENHNEVQNYMNYTMKAIFINNTGYILTCGSDQTFKIWDPSGQVVSSVNTSTSYIIWDFDIFPDGTTIVTADERSVSLWKIKHPLEKASNYISINKKLEWK